MRLTTSRLPVNESSSSITVPANETANSRILLAFQFSNYAKLISHRKSEFLSNKIVLLIAEELILVLTLRGSVDKPPPKSNQSPRQHPWKSQKHLQSTWRGWTRHSWRLTTSQPHPKYPIGLGSLEALS